MVARGWGDTAHASMSRHLQATHSGRPSRPTLPLSTLFSIQHCNDAGASSAPHSAVLQGLLSPLQMVMGFLRLMLIGHPLRVSCMNYTNQSRHCHSSLRSESDSPG